MGSLLADVRYALRTLRRNPLFTLMAVGTLALGIGATTAIFSVVNAVMLRPLPYRGADQLVIVWGDLRARNVQDWPFANPDFADLRAQASSFDGLAGLNTARNVVPGADGSAETIRTANVTTNIFSVLGLRVALGRDFEAADGAPPMRPAAQAGPVPAAAAPAGAALPRVCILSHGFWLRHFGGDPSLVGKTTQLGNITIEIVGILEPGAELLFPPGSNIERHPDLWSPMRVDFTQGNRNNVGLRVVGRLRPGVTVRQAQSDVDGIAAHLRRRFTTKETAGLYFRVEPIGTDLVADVRQTLMALSGAVLCVLLIACANVANLLLVRSSIRERELAVRAALGAGQARLVRQLLVESVVLAAGGCLLGLLVAQLAIRVLRLLSPDELPRLDTVAVDPVVLAFAVLMSAVAAVIFGLVPAIRSARPDLVEVLRKAGRISALSAGTRLRSAVVVAEVVLSFVLLVGSGLMLRSFAELQRVDPGFDPQGVLTFRLANLRLASAEEAGAFVSGTTARLQAIPGVESVAVGNPLPLDGAASNARYGTEAAAADPSRFQQADVRFVSPGYFETMRTKVVAGRTFVAEDNRPDALRVVIDSLVAKKAFPGESAVGKRLLSRIRTDDPETFDVIGVVEHQRQASMAEEGREGIFFAEALVAHIPGGRWVVRVAGEPMGAASAVRAAIAQIPGTPLVTELQPMTSFVDRATAKTRFVLILIGVFAAIAVALATIGLYSVLSTAVRQRTAEIGVRLALGAQGGSIFRMMVGHGLRLSGLGLLIGLGAAFLLAGALRSVLVGVRPTDPVAFAGAAALFLGIAIVAAGLPAWRASRLDPTSALRQE
jgi:putative ABC transport system permease protein